MLRGGESGTGGLLVIYCKEASGNGSLTACGVRAPINHSCAGGSSGGGSINVFLGSNLIASFPWTSNASGGESTAASSRLGGAGGAGTVNIGSIASGTFSK